MKFLIILIAFFSFSSFAQYMPKSKIGKNTNGLKIYSKKSKCEKAYSEKCFSIRETGNYYFSKVIPETQMKEDAESCIDDSDCQSKLELKMCSKENAVAIKNLDSMEVYCTWLRPEHIGEDASLKAQYETEQSAMDQEKESRSTKGSERETTLKQCARVALKDVPDLDPGSLTQVQLANQLANRQNKIKDCLAVLLREVISEKLDLDDL